MKRLRKHIIPWTLAVLMALTCGASAAFAGEDVQPVEGEAVGDTVSVEAEQSGVSQEDENADVSLEDENFGDGEPQTEETDNARLGDGSKETNPTVKVNYGGFIERVQDSVRVFPGETAGFTTKLLRFESNEETEYWSVKKVDDYIVKWIVVQTDKENGGEATINYYSTSVSKDTKRLDVTVNKDSPVSEISIRAEFYIGNEMVFNDQTVFLHVQRFIGKITDNCGGNEPTMPEDSVRAQNVQPLRAQLNQPISVHLKEPIALNSTT